MIHHVSTESGKGVEVAEAELEALSAEVAEAGMALDGIRHLASMASTRASVGLEGFEATLGDTVRTLEDATPVPGMPEATRRALRNYDRAMQRVAGLSVDPGFAWSSAVLDEIHFLVTVGEEVVEPGRIRTVPVHIRGLPAYEPPMPMELAGLIHELVEALRSPHQPLLAGIAAHLHLAAIHPYVDGNGRVARLIHCLATARAYGLPPAFASIEETLAADRAAYLRALASTNGHHRLGGPSFYAPTADTSAWVEYCAAAHVRRARHVRAAIIVSAARQALCNRLAVEAGMPVRVGRYLDFALVGLPTTNEAGRRRLGIPGPTVTVDLRRLTDAGLLVKRGRTRSTDYVASASLQKAWTSATIPVADSRLVTSVEEARKRDLMAIRVLAGERGIGQ